jgi:hypothetical protein
MTHSDNYNLRDKNLVNLNDIADAIDGILPVFTAWVPSSYYTNSAATWTSITATANVYCRFGDLIFINGSFSGTLSADTVALYIEGLPVPAHQSSGTQWAIMGQAIIGGLGYAGRGAVELTNNRVVVVRWDRADITSGATRGCHVQGWYRAA